MSYGYRNPLIVASGLLKLKIFKWQILVNILEEKGKYCVKRRIM